MSETQEAHLAVIICERCQKNYPEYYHRCPACGRTLKAYCFTCRKGLDGRPDVCPYTGAELEYREPDDD